MRELHATDTIESPCCLPRVCPPVESALLRTPMAEVSSSPCWNCASLNFAMIDEEVQSSLAPLTTLNLVFFCDVHLNFQFYGYPGIPSFQTHPSSTFQWQLQLNHARTWWVNLPSEPIKYSWWLLVIDCYITWFNGILIIHNRNTFSPTSRIEWEKMVIPSPNLKQLLSNNMWDPLYQEWHCFCNTQQFVQRFIFQIVHCKKWNQFLTIKN